MDRSRDRKAASNFIGRALTRVEDARLVTGAGRFVDDIALPNCLHLEFLRSPHARGRIRRLDVSAAAAAPGVVAVFTGTTIGSPGQAAVNLLVDGMRVPPFPILPVEKINAVGQPIAAIAAESLTAAQDALQLIEIEIEPLDLETAGEPAFAQHWRSGDVDAAFESAAHVARVHIAHSLLAPAPLEPRAALADWNTEEGKLTAFLSTQTPHRARKDLAAILDLPEERIHVIAPDVGGAFGGKASIYPEDAMVAIAARRLGRPVKWRATRSDDFLAATHGRGASLDGELAVSAEGELLALRAQLAFPLGHWLPYSAAAPGRNAGRILPGPYNVGAVDIAMRASTGNTSAVGIYRGAGRPEAALLMERLIDEAARMLSLDPAELRRRNLIGEDAFPVSTPTGEILDSGNYPALLSQACRKAGYDKLVGERSRRRAEGEICGIGIATYIEPCGQGFESASIHIEADGSIVAATGSSAQGQGRETAFAQIVADVLGIAPEHLSVRHGDTAHTPSGIGALASRSTAIGGSALFQAAETFRETARRCAAHLFRVHADQVVLTSDGFACLASGGREIGWRELGEAAHHNADIRQTFGPGLQANIIYHAEGEAWSSGCCIASVTIDAETGVPAIDGITWADDAGIIVNPLLAEGQMMGGMAQGLGEALMERLVYDGDGQLLTASFMDYAMPRAAHMPALHLHKIETPTPFNHLGAKGIGEAGCIGVPAAIVNAVVDALAPHGVRHIDMPLTSEKIWKALQSGANSKIEARKL